MSYFVTNFQVDDDDEDDEENNGVLDIRAVRRVTKIMSTNCTMFDVAAWYKTLHQVLHLLVFFLLSECGAKRCECCVHGQCKSFYMDFYYRLEYSDTISVAQPA